MRNLVLVFLLFAALPAHGQTNPRLNADTFRPSPHAGDIFGQETTATPKSWEASGGIWLNWNEKPLKVTNAVNGAERRIVARQIVTDLYGSIGLFDLLSLGVVLPVFLHASGDALPAELQLTQVAGAGLGDARVSVRALLLGNGDGFGLALSEDVGLPTATGDNFNGDTGVTSTTRVIGDWAHDGIRFALHVGFRAQKSVNFLNRAYGNFLGFGGAANYPILCGRLDVMGAVSGAVAASSAIGNPQDTTLDGLAGARVRWGALAISAGAGGGMLSGFGSPELRATLGVSYVPAIPGECGTGRAKPEQTEAERCSPVSGVVPAGCRPADVDQDGVADADDKCPAAAGTAATQGCPDADADGVADMDDKCPKVKGLAVDGGCPPDRDGDGVADADDKCPDLLGTAAKQGCPEQRVVVTKEKIAITETIQFEKGSDQIQKLSRSLLDEIVGIFKSHPEIKKVRIEGHTDNAGDPVVNLALSSKRALAVKAYLTGKGVAANRLQAQGIGDKQPIADNKTEEGRAKNRRVDFVILERGD